MSEKPPPWIALVLIAAVTAVAGFSAAVYLAVAGDAVLHVLIGR